MEELEDTSYGSLDINHASKRKSQQLVGKVIQNEIISIIDSF